MSDPNCATCREAERLQGALEGRVAAFRSTVNYHLQNTVTSLRRQRESLSKKLIVGKLLAAIFVPKPADPQAIYSEPWFQLESRAIDRDFYSLEALKKTDLEHWGEELVGVGDGSDPAGYYSREYTVDGDHNTRAKAYELKLSVFPPKKYGDPCPEILKALNC